MSRARTADERANQRRTVTGAAVMVGGLAVLAAAAVTAWSWRSELPDPVASHWGVSGEPDGFSSLGGLVASVLGIGAVLVLIFGGITWWLGQSAVNRRIGAGATAWVVVFLSIVLIGTLSVQRGLSLAQDAPDVGGVLLAAVVGSLISAVIVAIVVPGDERRPTTARVAADAPRVLLVAGDRTVWTAWSRTPAAFVVTLPVTALVVAAVVLTRLWALLVVEIVVVCALIMFTAFVVRVDRGGLSVRSALGWPRYRVPLDEVVRADVIHVSPLKDYGGWGWRVGRGGRVGVVLRKGEALLVERTGGRSIAVTADGALAAAGLLNALADRARQNP